MLGNWLVNWGGSMTPIEDYLREAGARRVRLSGDNYVSTCPFHKDSKPSFAMNKNNGMFVCYSAHCGVQGNLYLFLVNALDYTPDKAKKVVENFGLFESIQKYEGGFATLPDYDDRHQSGAKPDEASITEGQLGLYQFCPKYMTKRGFKKKTLRRWGVGYDFSTSRVTIPVRDRDWNLVGISKRATKDWQEPKYLHLGFSKGKHLYGENMRDGHDIAIVMEGQLDVHSFNQNDLDSPWLPVSTMGTRVTNRQIKMMRKFKTVVLAFDNFRIDADGLATTKKVGDALLPHVGANLFVFDFQTTNVKDYGDLLNQEVDYGRMILPYDSWRLESDQWSNNERSA